MDYRQNPEKCNILKLAGYTTPERKPIWKGALPVTIQVFFYPGFILIVLIFLLITVPRAAFRALLPYGIVLGGLLDYLWNLVLGNLFRIFVYTNHGIFNVSGQMFLAPLAWTLIIVFYLYFWPRDNRQLSYFYMLAWGGLATGFGQVVYLIELFEYSPWLYPLPMLGLFLARFAFAAWVAKPWTNTWD